MTENIAFWIWLAGLVIFGAIRISKHRRSSRTSIVHDQRTTLEKALLAQCVIGLFLLPLLSATSNMFNFADYAFLPIQGWLGMIVLILFLAIFFLTHRQLGRFWSITLELRENHALMTHGMFSRIRHPMYLSFWLWALGQALLIPNLIGGLTGLISIGLLYFGRINKEEAMMLEAFGDEYRSYMKRTGRIVPRFFNPSGSV